MSIGEAVSIIVSGLALSLVFVLVWLLVQDDDSTGKG